MPPTAQQVSALDLVLELAMLLDDDLTQHLGRQGLTVSRAHLLWELGRAGPVTQQALARAMGVSARNITGLVDGLAATGFVARQAHPTDRRATLVTFTKKGEKTVQALQRGQQELAQQLFTGWPDHQFGTFVTGLREVLARLRLASQEGR